MSKAPTHPLMPVLERIADALEVLAGDVLERRHRRPARRQRGIRSE